MVFAEGVTVEQAVDDGWRGRAQQIVMLKNKVMTMCYGVMTMMLLIFCCVDPPT